MYYMCLPPLLYCWHSDTYLQNKQKMGSTEKSFLPSLCEIVIQVKAECKVLQNGTQLLLCIHTHFLFILCTMVTVLSGTDLIICVSIFGYEQYMIVLDSKSPLSLWLVFLLKRLLTVPLAWLSLKA